MVCGRDSKNHIGAIEQHGDRAELVEICDTNPEALQAAEAVTKACRSPRSATCLAQGNADALVLVTPSGLAPWQSHRSGPGRSPRGQREAHGYPRWEDGKRMVKACDEPGCACSWSSRTAATPPCTWSEGPSSRAASAVIYLVTVNVFWTRPQSITTPPLARQVGMGRRRIHEPGQPLRGPAGLAGRPVESVYAYTYAGGRIEAEAPAWRLGWRHGAMELDQRHPC